MGVKLAWLIGTIIALPAGLGSVSDAVDGCLEPERQLTWSYLAKLERGRCADSIDEIATVHGVRPAVDRDGIPLRVRCTGDGGLELSATGPDRLFGTADDVNTRGEYPGPGGAVCDVALVGLVAPMGAAAPRELLR